MTDDLYPPGTVVTRENGILAGDPLIVIEHFYSTLGGEPPQLKYRVENCGSHNTIQYTATGLRRWMGDIDKLDLDSQRTIRHLRQTAVVLLPVSRLDLDAVALLRHGLSADTPRHVSRFITTMHSLLDNAQYVVDSDPSLIPEVDDAWAD